MKANKTELNLEQLCNYTNTFNGTNDMITVAFDKKLTKAIVEEAVRNAIRNSTVANLDKSTINEINKLTSRAYSGRITSYNSTNNTYNLELLTGEIKSIKRDSIISITNDATGTVVKRK